MVLFYQSIALDLKPYKPIPKFLAIKIVLFFSFWQSVLLALVVHIGWIPAVWGLGEEEISSGIQHLLITIEMFAVAILNIKAYPVDMYKVRVQSQAPLVHDIELGGSKLKGVASAFNQSDVISDTRDAFRFKRPGVDDDDSDIEQIGKIMKPSKLRRMFGRKKTKKHIKLKNRETVQRSTASSEDSSDDDYYDESEEDPRDKTLKMEGDNAKTKVPTR